jgi:dTDP-4-amino-4,6-dideoxygalactose transaminase
MKRGALPVAEQACREVLSLPLSPYMPETAVEEVAARVREFYSAA